MPTGYTYATFQAALGEHLVMSTSDTDFVAMLPSIIDAGELSCYRDLDPLFTRRTHQGNIGMTGTVNDAVISAPADSIDIREMWLFWPGPIGTKRVQLDRRDESWVNSYNPDRTVTGVPKYYAIIGADYGPQVSSMGILLAPCPDQMYAVTIADTYRPATLSATQTTTYLSQYYPDLFMYACLVYASGWQKNYGASSDDPTHAVSWQSKYDKALAAARTEEGRRKSRMWSDRGSGSAPPITAP